MLLSKGTPLGIAVCLLHELLQFRNFLAGIEAFLDLLAVELHDLAHDDHLIGDLPTDGVPQVAEGFEHNNLQKLCWQSNGRSHHTHHRKVMGSAKPTVSVI